MYERIVPDPVASGTVRQLVFVAIRRYFTVRVTSMNIDERNAIGRISSFLYLRPTRCD
jgi:hypothetical protein